jgi:hypothetical protein
MLGLFLLSVAVVVLATIAVFVQTPLISNYAFWIAIISYAMMLKSTVSSESPASFGIRIDRKQTQDPRLSWGFGVGHRNRVP